MFFFSALWAVLLLAARRMGVPMPLVEKAGTEGVVKL
jgi:hypothetical protein